MILIVLGYVALVAFVVGMGVRVVHFANTPVHLRWELYPVPHEPAEKAKYGGSYLEELDWWTKPKEVDHLHELMDMLGEMLLIKALWHSRKPMWFVSFPFHAGLYLLMGLVVVLIADGILAALGVTIALEGGILGALAWILTALLGFAGFALGLVGAIGLLIRRLTDPDLKDFTGPIDHLNLLFFVVLFGAGLATMATDPGAEGWRAYFTGLVTLKAPLEMNVLSMVTTVLGAVMVTYIPFTHMSHMAAKYFTWHSVRWNDEALLPGNAIDKAIHAQLQYPVSWSASHIGGDGHKTWAEVCTTNPTKEVQS
jgi:nitrate reductase gamma subunit